jgi:soluble cytochrome b562
MAMAISQATVPRLSNQDWDMLCRAKSSTVHESENKACEAMQSSTDQSCSCDPDSGPDLSLSSAEPGTDIPLLLISERNIPKTIQFSSNQETKSHDPDLVPVHETQHLVDSLVSTIDERKDAANAGPADAHETCSEKGLGITAAQTVSTTYDRSQRHISKGAQLANEVVPTSLQNTYHRAFKRLNFFGRLATGAKQLIQTHMQVTCNIKLPTMECPDVMRSMQASAGTLQGAIRKAPRAQRRRVLLITTDQSPPSVGSGACCQGSDGAGTAAIAAAPTDDPAPTPIASA